MKRLMMTALLLTGLSATAADEYHTIIKCNRINPIADNGLQVKVMTGGIAGNTVLQVDRSLFTGGTTKTYIVRRLPMDRRLVGAPVVYRGQDVELSINYTTSPVKGGHYAVLQEMVESGQVLIDDNLYCKNVK